MTWGVVQLNDDELSVSSAIKKKLHEEQIHPEPPIVVGAAVLSVEENQHETTESVLTQQDVLDSPSSASFSITGLDDLRFDSEPSTVPVAPTSSAAAAAADVVFSSPGLPVCYVLIPDVLEHEAARTREEAFTHNYGKLEYLDEVRQVCSELGYDTRVFPVRMNNFRSIIQKFEIPHNAIGHENNNNNNHHHNSNSRRNRVADGGNVKPDVVFSLCDGNEFDGFPGASVAEYLEQHGYRFAGCDSSFLRTTTDKALMKDVFRRAGVSTAPSVTIQDCWDPEVHPQLLSKMHFPLLVKLGDSYGSIGLTEKSIVYDLHQAEQHINRMLAENFKLLVIEEFINGPEFTVLVVGDSDSEMVKANPQARLHVYAPAERVFDASLGPMQRWLSYELVWVELGKRYNYAPVLDPADEQALIQLARDAYISVGGNSFGRVDIRKSNRTGQFYVLEVNASCGIGYDSSSDCILRLHGHSTHEFLNRVLSSARRLDHTRESL